ncbi:MAG: hypothetical protein NTY19_12235 [Planctomycetota bacterium]|nr:hypothetical protein [Planctomycetota bacterium]
MSAVPTAPEVFDREFLEIRAKVLEVAACFDRLDRAPGTVEQDPRMVRLRQVIGLLLDASPDRAERTQLVFSREYDEDWRKKFGL